MPSFTYSLHLVEQYLKLCKIFEIPEESEILKSTMRSHKDLLTSTKVTTWWSGMVLVVIQLFFLSNLIREPLFWIFSWKSSPWRSLTYHCKFECGWSYCINFTWLVHQLNTQICLYLFGDRYFHWRAKSPSAQYEEFSSPEEAILSTASYLQDQVPGYQMIGINLLEKIIGLPLFTSHYFERISLQFQDSLSISKIDPPCHETKLFVGYTQWNLKGIHCLSLELWYLGW